ncbi:MAG: glycoside hydrolase family 25 protein [Lachnospiraceae bacterium]|nr:glycoside hydrolase family 25 protein [Lachnospiraceae bacterium]
MGRHNYKIWLIPAIIIGFNCLAFIVILAISINKESKPSPATDTVSGDSPVSFAGEYETEEAGQAEGDRTGDEPTEPEEAEDKPGLDESIYDDEVEEADQGSGYVLLLTSSDSDLRVRIADTNGGDPSDMNWTVTVTRTGEDQEETDASSESTEEVYETTGDSGDGILYLDEVQPGSYNVVADNGSGIVESSSITVKPRIRYTASAGIRSIVMQESDIDAATEDTGSTPEEKESEAESQGEGTEQPSGISLPQGTLGIDVSKYNKEIDWNAVRSSGVEFAIIRAGYRGSSTGVLVEDPYFGKNLAGAKAAGIKIGVYFFTQAITPGEAAEEAEAVASLVNASDLSLPVFLDVESSGNSNGGRADPLDKAARTEIVRTFCETAEGLGYDAGVYANKTWMTKYLDMEQLAPYTKWLAQYRAEGPTYEGDYSIWQYTSNGSVDGINGRVDLDIFIK